MSKKRNKTSEILWKNKKQPQTFKGQAELAKIVNTSEINKIED